MHQRQIEKHLKKQGVEGCTIPELLELYPQSEEELHSTIKRLFAKNKVMRLFVLRDGHKIHIHMNHLFKAGRFYAGV